MSLSPNLKGKPRSPPPRLQSLRRGDSQRLRSTVQGIKTTCRWSLGATFIYSLFSLSLAPTKITNVSCSQNNYTYLNYGWPLRLQHGGRSWKNTNFTRRVWCGFKMELNVPSGDRETESNLTTARSVSDAEDEGAVSYTHLTLPTKLEV